MDANKTFSSGENATGDTWYVDNYILLKEYYDMTISRIAARCIRKGNIAMEEYDHYPYILDVLEEISETGDYIITHNNLYEYVERKIPGGMNTLKKNLKEFKTELQNNASPEMIKQDPNEVKNLKEALGEIDSSKDPTSGAGMSMDDVINKLMQQNNITPNFTEDNAQNNGVQPQAPQPQVQQPQAPQPQAPQPQVQQPQPQAPRPQVQQPQASQPQAPQPQVQQPQASQPQAPRPQVQQPQTPQPQAPRPQVQQPQTPQPQAPQPQVQQSQAPQPQSPQPNS